MSYARDALAVTGSGCLVFGVWSIYRPAGWIAAGILLLALSLAGYVRGAR